MRAADEVARLQQKLDDGSLHPDEPLFTLRAQDKTASMHVRNWCLFVGQLGTPGVKITEALALADEMDAWPMKQTPGRPETGVCMAAVPISSVAGLSRRPKENN